MSIATICPKCGTIVVPVDSLPVKTYLKKQFIEDLPLDSTWHICPNQTCDISYFSSDIIFSIYDLTIPLWFKNRSLDVPICYCANITRGDIHASVQSGHKTVKTIRVYLDKNMPCDCKRLNPLGRCCCKAFNHEIDIAIAKFK